MSVRPEDESFVIVTTPETPVRSPLLFGAPDLPRPQRRGILKSDSKDRDSRPRRVRLSHAPEPSRSIISIGGDSDCFDDVGSDLSDLSSSGSASDIKEISERLRSAYSALSSVPDPDPTPILPALSLPPVSLSPPVFPFSPPSSPPPVAPPIPPAPPASLTLAPELVAAPIILSSPPAVHVSSPPTPLASAPSSAPHEPDYWTPTKKYSSMQEEADAIKRMPPDKIKNENRIRLARLHGF